MKTTKIEYGKTILEVPEFLKPFWPFLLSLTAWPSYCGAGRGMGDWLIPDKISGVRISCCCFEHDISWAIAPNTFAAFLECNTRFYKNVRQLVLANYNPGRYSKWGVEAKCFGYFFGVSTFGRKHFKSDKESLIVAADPRQHPTVIKRLERLELATMDSQEAQEFYGV